LIGTTWFPKSVCAILTREYDCIAPRDQIVSIASPISDVKNVCGLEHRRTWPTTWFRQQWAPRSL